MADGLAESGAGNTAQQARAKMVMLGGERQYPETESFVCGLLVEIIEKAQTWHEIERAAYALFHVRLKAKMLRDEVAKFRVENGLGQSEASERGPFE